MMRIARVARPLLAGALVAVSVPPFGWWPLGLSGIALLARVVSDRTRSRDIATDAFAFGIGLFLPSLWWLTGFSLPGGLLVIALQAAITAVAITIAARGSRPGSPRRSVALVVGIGFAELARSSWPFGGLPLGGIDLGQADGPLAPLAAWGGRMLVVVATVTVGVAIARLAARRVPSPVSIGLVLVLLAGIAFAHIAPDGTRARGSIRIAVVQGGGPRGQRTSPQAAQRTFDAHLRATTTVRGPLDLVVWPEDVVDVDRFADSREERLVAEQARRIGAPIVVGIVEDGAPGRFRNASVVVPPEGESDIDGWSTTDGRFDKVHRVPYGEYFPFRSTIEGLGLADLPARDASPGRGPGVIATPVGPLAVAISYEAFFPDRARSGVRAGGALVLVPTNASSYPTAQVPTQQLAAARLRARETGRWLVQAAPTGFSAVLTPGGRVVARTDLGAADVLRVAVVLRSGLTLAARLGDGPAAAALVLALAVLVLVPGTRGRETGAGSRATARFRRRSH